MLCDPGQGESDNKFLLSKEAESLLLLNLTPLGA